MVMRRMAIAGVTAVLAASVCFAKEPQESQSQQAQSQKEQGLRAEEPQEQQATQQLPPQASAPPVAGQPQELIVPAGTHVPLTLTSPIHTGHAKPGDLVRLNTAFPVTIHTQVAIPTGTYVEGVIDRVSKRASLPSAAVQMHFTHIVFADGYNVPLDAALLQTSVATRDNHFASASDPVESSTTHSDMTSRPAFVLVSATPVNMSLAQFPGNPPTLPPLPKNGPSIGAVVGGGLAATAAFVVAMAILNRHSVDTVFDVGTQFEMILRTDLVLDAQSVVASIAAAPAR